MCAQGSNDQTQLEPNTSRAGLQHAADTTSLSSPPKGSLCCFPSIGLDPHQTPCLGPAHLSSTPLIPMPRQEMHNKRLRCTNGGGCTGQAGGRLRGLKGGRLYLYQKDAAALRLQVQMPGAKTPCVKIRQMGRSPCLQTLKPHKKTKAVHKDKRVASSPNTQAGGTVKPVSLSWLRTLSAKSASKPVPHHKCCKPNTDCDLKSQPAALPAVQAEAPQAQDATHSTRAQTTSPLPQPLPQPVQARPPSLPCADPASLTALPLLTTPRPPSGLGLLPNRVPALPLPVIPRPPEYMGGSPGP